jgi:hypothetical protein
MGLFNKISKFGMPLVIALSVVLGMFVQQKIDLQGFDFNANSKQTSNK